MYLANKVQNIRGAADTLLELAGIEPEEIRPVAEAMERGGRLAAKAEVTDSILDRCKPIAGTPEDCIAAIEEYRDAGCTHVMLELWGANRHGQIGSSARRCCRTSDDRPRPPRGLALRLVSTPTFTGDEEAAAELMRDELASLGLQVQWQQVEDGRANVLGTWPGAGGGPQPDAERPHGHLVLGPGAVARRDSRLPAAGLRPDGRVYGLGISNMKGALACYVEAVRALREAGVRLRGDLLVAAVAGEIEKTQWGDAQGAEYRGYAAGHAPPRHARRRRRHVHPRRADREQGRARRTSARSGCGSRRHGPFVHTAFSEGRLEENSIVRMRDVLDAVVEWIPSWEEEMSWRGARGARQRRRDPGRLRLAG